MDTNMETSNRTDAVHDELQETLNQLSQSVSQLQTDVGTLLSHTMEAGKSGVGLLRNQAHQAMDGIKNRVADLKHAGADSIHNVEDRIEQSPFTSVVIAMGIGFILASVLHRS